MDQKTEEFRKKIAEMFISTLQADPLAWRKGWANSLCMPQNAVTGAKYRGINFLYLLMEAKQRGYEDLRFATFKQINDNGWRIKKGSKGLQVEYWYPWDYKKRQSISWEEFRARTTSDKMGVKARYYYVFNAEDIEGIPQLQSNEKTKIEISQLVEKISENMKVPIVHKSVEDPYYSLPEDTIYMPYPEQFANAYEYNAAALHEEAHATGVESRLNRDTYLDYAKEELVAEITAAFMAQHVQEELTSVSFTDQDMQNHMAYVQSWISSIQDKPEALLEAIRDAEQASNLLEYHGGIITEAKYQMVRQSTKEVANELVVNDAKTINHSIPNQVTNKTQSSIREKNPKKNMRPDRVFQKAQDSPKAPNNPMDEAEQVRSSQTDETERASNNQTYEATCITTDSKIAILQLREGEENQSRRFMDMNLLKMICGEKPSCDNYELIFVRNETIPKEAEEQRELLDIIYEEFNEDTIRPVNYYGTSISIGDVIVIEKEQEEYQAYFVNSKGLTKLPDDFLSREMSEKIHNGMDIRREYLSYEQLMQIGAETNIPMLDNRMTERYSRIKDNYMEIFELADKRAITIADNHKSCTNCPAPEDVKEYNVQEFLDHIKTDTVTEKETMDFIRAHQWEIKSPVHDPLGNVLTYQAAITIEDGWKAELRFHNSFDPRMINMGKGGNVQSEIALWITPVNPEDVEKTMESRMITLWKQSSTSLRRGQNNYFKMQEKWKEITGQEAITFGKALSPVPSGGRFRYENEI